MFFTSSTVDWCEKNYEITPLIAEFYNTITGLCIFVSMYAFKTQNQDLFNIFFFKDFANNMNNIYMYSFLISFGTVMFHGTLLYFFQLLDELPLILIMTEYIEILVKVSESTGNNKFSKTLFFKYIKKAKPVSLIICMLLPFTYLISNQFQILSFHLSLKIFEISVVLCLYNLKYKKYKYDSNCDEFENHINLSYQKHLNDIEYYSYKGISVYILSVSAWLIEKLYCNNDKMILELHAFWHIFSSLGFYYFNYIILSHIHLYYLLNSNHTTTNQPPSSPN